MDSIPIHSNAVCFLCGMTVVVFHCHGQRLSMCAPSCVVSCLTTSASAFYTQMTTQPMGSGVFVEHAHMCCTLSITNNTLPLSMTHNNPSLIIHNCPSFLHQLFSIAILVSTLSLCVWLSCNPSHSTKCHHGCVVGLCCCPLWSLLGVVGGVSV